MNKTCVLTIAGSDPSGGAGIQADLKTFHQHGLYGMAAITLITVQNTFSVSDIQYLDSNLVKCQILAVLEDIPPKAIKLGALGNEKIIEEIHHLSDQFKAPLIIDPVMISKHGKPLLAAKAVEALRLLIDKAYLVTPNIPEAEALANLTIEEDPMKMRKAAQIIYGLGCKAVLIKGGHLKKRALDVLYDGKDFFEFETPRIKTENTHGTGCTYSAAITANIAKGLNLNGSILKAKQFINEAIRTNPRLGHGCGPLNHHAESPA